MADHANAGANACLPRDVLASILLGLPASDLRRFRRVCKEWREVISDPAFIDEHTVHGPRDLNHTIVFFPTRRYAEEPPNGSGFLFDEQWRLTATFTAGRSEDMIGTCNGLLCFLNGDQGPINIMEPFTGESLALPLPPETKQQREESRTYCFGFDHSSRRYKIVHGGFYVRRDDTMDQELQVYTVGGGESWRSVPVADAAEHDLVGVPVYADGVVYWSVRGEDWVMKLACLDLATEEVTWEGLDPEPSAVGPDARAEHDGGAGRTAARVCVMTMRGQTHAYWTVLFAGQGGHCVPDSVELPPLRRPSLPQPLQRAHLLLEDYAGGNLYAHPVVPASNDVGSGKLLLKRDKKEELPKEQAKSSSTGQHADRTPSCNTRGLFIPALFNQAHAGIVGRIPHQQGYAVTFCYAPPVSPAPLAHYFGKL